jgi:hypothetical protein
MPELNAVILRGAALPIARFRPHQNVDAGVDVVNAGVEAWRRRKADVRACWDDHVLIGKALLVGRAEAMALAGKNTPAGKAYNNHFSHWLREHHFDDIDPADRAKLMTMVENLAEIEAWRDSLPEATRLKQNHPSAVWRAWKCQNRGGRWRDQQAGTAEMPDDAEQAHDEPEPDSEPERAPSAASVHIKANKAAGLAHDCRQFEGDVSINQLRAVKATAQAWAELADLFEARLSELQ